MGANEYGTPAFSTRSAATCAASFNSCWRGGPPIQSFAHLLSKFGAVDRELLHPSQDIAESPVNSQTGREAPTEHAHHQGRHESQHFLLGRIHACLGSALLGHEHGDGNGNG